MNTIRSLFSIDSSPRNKRNGAIEGIRGVAILLVFFYHYADIVVPQLRIPADWQRSVALLAQIGRTGVALFFVLSGYLIYQTVARGNFHLLRFWGRRMQRIYPTFLAVFCVYLALWIFHIGKDRTGETLGARIPHDTAAACGYIVQNLLFLPGIFPISPLMNVAWSLSYEWLYYLVIPLGALALGRIASRGWRLSFIAFLVASFLAVCCLFPDSCPFLSRHPGLVLFLAGVFVYEGLPLRTAVSRLEWLGLGLIVTALALPSFLSGSREIATTACTFAAYGLLLYLSQQGAGLIERALCIAPLRSLGNISYSFYLIHSLPLHLAASLVARSSHTLSRIPGANTAALFALLPVCLLFTTAVSLALFLAVERPLSLRPPQRPTEGVADRALIAEPFAEGRLPA